MLVCGAATEVSGTCPCVQSKLDSASEVTFEIGMNACTMRVGKLTCPVLVYIVQSGHMLLV